MSNQNQSIYVGSAKELPNGRLKIDLNLTELFEATKNNQDVKEAIRAWKSKTRKENKSISLVVFPLKPENRTDHRTHSAKIDTWKPEQKKEPESPTNAMPF